MTEHAKEAHMVAVGSVLIGTGQRSLYLVGLATERECERAVRERHKTELNLAVRATGRLTPGFLKDLKPPLLYGEVRAYGDPR
jgi:hypothetical protein